jgi:MOB kinase activator 1
MAPSNAGTFQPLQHRSGTLRERLHSYTKSTLGAGGSLNEAVSAIFTQPRQDNIYPLKFGSEGQESRKLRKILSYTTHALKCFPFLFPRTLERIQVALPPGESCAAWVAVHAIDFFNDVSTIWAVSTCFWTVASAAPFAILLSCSPQFSYLLRLHIFTVSTDPYLSSFRPGEGFPSGVEYRWSDDKGDAVSVSAPVYIEKVLGWIADQMNDETKFPDDDDEKRALAVFQTPQFAALCGQIFRRLFRVYGIIYSSFFGTLEALDMAPHLNSCFKHFMFFCTEFGLLPEREIEPLEVLVKPIRKQYFQAKQQ